MIGFMARRLLQAIIVVLGVTLLVFVLQHILPGNLARAILGPRAAPGEIATFDRANGLDQPLVVQYLTFLGHVLRGNLGYSYRLNQSVDSLVVHELPDDVILVGSALVLALAIAIPLGVAQALRLNRAFDHGATGLSFVVYSMPSYWLALLLIAGLSIGARVFPAEAPQASSITGVLADPRALVLPVLTLTLVNIALFSLYMRSSVIGTLAEDYIRVARSKGLDQRQLVLRHVLRNSLASVVTLVGLSLPAVLTSGLIIEYVFNFPGVGLTYYTAAVNADYPVMLGITVLVGFVTVLGSLLADLTYAVLDPRVRYG
jgi:peptide/nickel transport system permease protein